MSPDKDMKQCLLQKDSQEHIAWLPKEFAVPGKLIDFKAWGVWQEGWTVFQVYSMVLREDYVREHQRIDLPSIQ